MAGGINWEFEINRYTLLYIKQINNKDLLYSTGTYIQYPVRIVTKQHIKIYSIMQKKGR